MAAEAVADRAAEAVAATAPDALAAPEPDDEDVAVLDAYSAAVSHVAETLIRSVASLRVTRSNGGWPAAGSGSAGAFTPDG